MSSDSENKKDKAMKNNWKSFGMSVVSSFCTVLIIGLLGANFVYYTRINLDLFFPSDLDQRPYTNENKNGSKLAPFLFAEIRSSFFDSSQYTRAFFAERESPLL